MARTNNLTNFLNDVATAIKEKKGDSTAIPAANFDTEILSLPSQGVYQTKTMTITTNGTTTITPDQDYDAIEELELTINVPSENLDSVITAQEQKLEALETLLEGKVSGSAKPNIFLQDTEPTKKQGVWLKTTGKEYEKVVAEDSVVVEPTWLPDGSITNIPYSFYNGSAVAIGTDIYILGGSAYSTFNYKYDTLNNTYTQLTNIPYDFLNGSAVAIGTDIYLFGSNNNTTLAYKYNTLTDTYTQLTNIPYQFRSGSAVAIGTNIYILGGSNSSLFNYKYDTLTDTYIQLTNIPYDFSSGSAVAIGTDIYLLGSGIGSGTTNYKYDTLNNTYIQLTNIPYSFSIGSAVAIGTDIYLLGGASSKTYNYKYNTLTNTYTRMVDIPYDFHYGSAVLVSTDIYLFGGYTKKTKVQVLVFPSSDFDDQSIVLLNGSTYKTQLYSNELVDNSVKYSFSDVWLYEESEGGLETDTPTYYGDGTQWINIKNPPTEGGNE